MKPAKTPARRNPYVVANIKRHANTTKTMKDRRTPRGGIRNKQSDYRSERY
jgi:hypothetical protein